MADAKILELKGVSKNFGAVQALAKVDFETRAGEVMALPVYPELTDEMQDHVVDTISNFLS